MILQACHNNPGRPSFEHAAHYNPLGNPFDGVVQELRKQSVTKIKEEFVDSRPREVNPKYAHGIVGR